MLRKETVEQSTLDILKQCMKLHCLSDFVLVGGTALSLQLGHRISIDLDFFGNVKKLEEEEFSKSFKEIGNTVLANKSQVMLGYFINNLKIDVVKYKYPLIKSPLVIEGIRMARPEDIAAMKFAAITGRGKKKDFTDLYYLLEHFTFEEMFEFYNMKYADGNNMIVLRSLAYFEDADKDIDPIFIDKNISWEKIKFTIENKLNKYLNTL